MNPNEEWTRFKVSKNTIYLLDTLKDICNCIDYDETEFLNLMIRINLKRLSEALGIKETKDGIK
jgi:hypothetical protein